MELPSPWLCMDDEEYSRWAEANARTSGTQRVERPCQDCPLSFSREMRSIGKCNGMPSGANDSGDEEEMTLEVTRARSKPVAVSVVSPCGRCTHREVCGIRPSIETLDTEGTDVALPPLNAALTPTLAISIECGFFAPEKRAKAGRPPGVAARPGTGVGDTDYWTPERREAQAQRIRDVNARKAAERAAQAS